MDSYRYVQLYKKKCSRQQTAEVTANLLCLCPLYSRCTFLRQRHCHILRKRSLCFPHCHKHCPGSSAGQASAVFREVRLRLLEWIHVFEPGFLAVRKPKNAEEERKLISNGTPKSTIPLKKYYLKNVFWSGRMVGKQKSGTRALRIHNLQFLSVTLGHCYPILPLCH